MVVPFVLAAAVLSACGTNQTAGVAQRSQAGAAAAPERVPFTIDWDHPIVRGLPSSARNARADGALRFAARGPRYGATVRGVQVTNPRTMSAGHRAVAYLYDFAPSAAFPAGGRVVVQEHETTKTVATLLAIADNPPGPREDFVMVALGAAAADRGLLIQNAGIGRVMFVANGVLYDITGPAVPVATVLALSRQAYAEATGH